MIPPLQHSSPLCHVTLVPLLLPIFIPNCGHKDIIVYFVKIICLLSNTIVQGWIPIGDTVNEWVYVTSASSKHQCKTSTEVIGIKTLHPHHKLGMAVLCCQPALPFEFERMEVRRGRGIGAGEQGLFKIMLPT